ncbi:MAG: hypothetical protein LBK28_06385 [Propionibacteriaceae bacterium]|nr:hypothetical protein [Propionibacteriaceae bacterium]
MPNYEAIAQSFTSPEALLKMSAATSIAFGAKKQSVAAFELWNSAQERFIGPSVSFRAPGGHGSGFFIRIYWDPTKTATPDLSAVEVAINTALPVKLTKDDDKAGTKQQRNKKQPWFFSRMGTASSPLSQWFLEKFGVYAVANQVMSESDFTENAVAVAVKDGVDYLWAFEA